jgi:hypothetical protein
MSKKKRLVLWTSFLFCLFLSLFFTAKDTYAQTPQHQNTQMNASDKALLALLSKSPSPTSATPPKINNHDVYLASSLTPTEHSDVESPQRCMYNNQPYVLGDMVNTEQCWIRCTSTLYFAADQPTSAQQGQSVWIKVQ